MLGSAGPRHNRSGIAWLKTARPVNLRRRRRADRPLRLSATAIPSARTATTRSARSSSAQGLDRRVHAARAARPRPARNSSCSTMPAYVDFVVARSADRRGLPRRRRYAGVPGRVRGRPAMSSAPRWSHAMRSWRAGVKRAFVPIAGLHHAGRAPRRRLLRLQRLRRRDRAAERDARARAHRLRRHRCAPRRRRLLRVRGRPGGRSSPTCTRTGATCIPGTGRRDETGTGAARGTKLNLPLPPGAGDAEFFAAWAGDRGAPRAARARVHPLPVRRRQPRRAIRSRTCALTEEAHAHAAARLCADRRPLRVPDACSASAAAGYNRRNLARAWTGVVQAFVESA